jgi:hypothetical protein
MTVAASADLWMTTSDTPDPVVAGAVGLGALINGTSVVVANEVTFKPYLGMLSTAPQRRVSQCLLSGVLPSPAACTDRGHG